MEGREGKIILGGWREKGGKRKRRVGKGEGGEYLLQAVEGLPYLLDKTPRLKVSAR